MKFDNEYTFICMQCNLSIVKQKEHASPTSINMYITETTSRHMDKIKKP